MPKNRLRTPYLDPNPKVLKCEVYVVSMLGIAQKAWGIYFIFGNMTLGAKVRKTMAFKAFFGGCGALALGGPGYLQLD